MPAHNADLNDPKNVLRILLALVLKEGGELRVKASLYDSLDRGRLLMVDFDSKKGDILLRATSDFGRAIVVQPESAAWVRPPETAPRERARTEAEQETARDTVHTDEELADREEAMARRAELAKLVREGKTPLKLKTVK